MDGHRINNLLYGSAMNVYNQMAVQKIKRIEIIRGPGSALYGANAFLAVVNIITKEAKDIDNIEVTLGGGENSTQHYNVLFGESKGDFSMSGAIDYIETDGEKHLIEIASGKSDEL